MGYSIKFAVLIRMDEAGLIVVPLQALLLFKMTFTVYHLTVFHFFLLLIGLITIHNKCFVVNKGTKQTLV